jgi:ABC-type sugar transport system ATPase subunit
MGTVVIQDVSANYGSVKAVQRVSLVANDGDFVVVFGPSGAGKTTLLNVIAGVKAPSSGQVFLNQHDVTRWEPWQRNVAMVFENYALYPHWTVFDNIASPLVKRKVPKAIIREQVLSLAAMLGIDTLLERKPSEISNGQKQRVAIGRGLIRKSEVLLMDEPLAHLDAKLRNEMRTELILMKRRIKQTIIYVTHDYREAMALADHLVVMRDGIIEQEGSPASVFQRPHSLNVVRLLGNPPRSVLKLDVVDSDGHTDTLSVYYAPWNLRCRMHYQGHPEGRSTPETVMMAILGRHVKVARNSEPCPRNACRIRAPVTLIEHQGSYAILTVGDAVQELQIRCAPNELEGIAIGDELDLDMVLDDALFYDTAGHKLEGTYAVPDAIEIEGV